MNKQKITINLVRSIMRLHGKNQIWNNRYENGLRTIKCYRDRDHSVDESLEAIVGKVLRDLNIDFSIKYTKWDGSPWNSGTGGFIVKLPTKTV
jgi:hypothetical protein